jgi:CubicO group peptidase (beta-lactamase class C family)
MKKNFFLLLALTLLSLHGFSQTLDKAKLDSYFDALAANNKFMGSVAISKNGQVIYTKAVGFADVATNKKPDANSKYRIGSISKTFTTTLIFKAVEEGKLSLDKTIASYFPTIKNADKITIGNLLNHRSGIHNFTDDESYTDWDNTPQTEAQMIAIIAKGGSDFEPGFKASYSNSNFILATYILEKTYKKTYSELIEKYITKPAGLKYTKVGNKISLANNEVNSYSYKGKWVKEDETDMSIPVGAGAIISTPSDLTKFAEALFNSKLISQKSVNQMKTITEGYGMGLFEKDFDGKKAYGHNGGIDGFTSALEYFPDEKIAYAITCNGGNYSQKDIIETLLKAAFNKEYAIPGFTTVTLTAAELDKYIGVYASKDIPLKITVSKEEATLMAQATGQGAFPLDAMGNDTFAFSQAGIEMVFNPAKKTFVLKQGGAEYNYTKE